MNIGNQQEEAYSDSNSIISELSASNTARGDWLKPDIDLLENSIKREALARSNGNAFRIVFGTSGKYPDGTSWERGATQEEISEYRNFCAK